MATPLNICTVGYGMMGRMHSEALSSRGDCRLHSVVGLDSQPTSEFAREFGYGSWHTDLDSALLDPAVDVVIVASPSELHAAHAIKALENSNHVLLEIPIAMSLMDSESIVAIADTNNCNLAVNYPMRMMPTMRELKCRLQKGQENIRMIESRFFIKRWENVGWTGIKRTWTDNLLWHHLGHFLDFGLWLTDEPIATVTGHQSLPNSITGTPMHAHITVVTEADQSMVVAGSYAGHRSIIETLILTDHDCYVFDALSGTLTTNSGSIDVQNEQADSADVLNDFIDSILTGRSPSISGKDVIPTMEVLQKIQNIWEEQTQVLSIPGRQSIQNEEQNAL